MTTLHLDFETRSVSDIRAEGMIVYAKHPSTQIICMAWAFDEEEPQVWFPDQAPFPKRVLDHLNAAQPRSIHAFNAGFERAIIENVLPRYLNVQTTTY